MCIEKIMRCVGHGKKVLVVGSDPMGYSGFTFLCPNLGAMDGARVARSDKIQNARIARGVDCDLQDTPLSKIEGAFDVMILINSQYDISITELWYHVGRLNVVSVYTCMCGNASTITDIQGVLPDLNMSFVKRIPVTAPLVEMGGMIIEFAHLNESGYTYIHDCDNYLKHALLRRVKVSERIFHGTVLEDIPDTFLMRYEIGNMNAIPGDVLIMNHHHKDIGWVMIVDNMTDKTGDYPCEYVTYDTTLATKLYSSIRGTTFDKNKLRSHASNVLKDSVGHPFEHGFQKDEIFSKSVSSLHKYFLADEDLESNSKTKKFYGIIDPPMNLWERFWRRDMSICKGVLKRGVFRNMLKCDPYTLIIQWVDKDLSHSKRTFEIVCEDIDGRIINRMNRVVDTMNDPFYERMGDVIVDMGDTMMKKYRYENGMNVYPQLNYVYGSEKSYIHTVLARNTHESVIRSSCLGSRSHEDSCEPQKDLVGKIKLSEADNVSEYWCYGDHALYGMCNYSRHVLAKCVRECNYIFRGENLYDGLFKIKNTAFICNNIMTSQWTNKKAKDYTFITVHMNADTRTMFTNITDDTTIEELCTDRGLIFIQSLNINQLMIIEAHLKLQVADMKH
eukprot:GHVR01029158.1.p1 GENE.GHVR01029158.1~~GHVR01029158.1.p1  ORF type:complete len:617 (+),score=58.69 GHVR01029158.1:405-2255(+)